MMHIPLNAVADGAVTLTAVVGAPSIVGIGIALAVCVGAIVGAALARADARRDRATAWPVIVPSAEPALPRGARWERA